jgi:hypothetical protein
MARGGHGLPNVSPGPYPSTPRGQATPETAPWPSSTPSDTRRRSSMHEPPSDEIITFYFQNKPSSRSNSPAVVDQFSAQRFTTCTSANVLPPTAFGSVPISTPARCSALSSSVTSLHRRTARGGYELPLKFNLGTPCPTLLRPVGRPPLKAVYGRLWPFQG